MSSEDTLHDPASSAEAVSGPTALAGLAWFYASVSIFAGGSLHFAAPVLAAVGIGAGAWSTIASVKRGAKHNQWIGTIVLIGSVVVLVVSLVLLTAT